ncbi:hypothetical protein CPC08DRAFT_788384 [Agrocybe pediades]|nr:hypothetical protein CPC08DRAFT_788384 [Agrocybe pediades]
MSMISLLNHRTKIHGKGGVGATVKTTLINCPRLSLLGMSGRSTLSIRAVAAITANCERYEPDSEEMKMLFDAERDVNVEDRAVIEAKLGSHERRHGYPPGPVGAPLVKETKMAIAVPAACIHQEKVKMGIVSRLDQADARAVIAHQRSALTSVVISRDTYPWPMAMPRILRYISWVAALILRIVLAEIYGALREQWAASMAAILDSRNFNILCISFNVDSIPYDLHNITVGTT